MEPNKEQLEQEIAATTQSLLHKMEQLEESTLQTVQSVTDGVKQTAETIQESLESLSLSYQMNKRPGVVIAASVGLGALIAMRSRSRNASVVRRPSMARSLASILFVEASRVAAPALLGVGVGIMAEMAKKKYPKAKEAISVVEGLVASRL